MKVDSCYIVYNSGAGKNNAMKLASKIKEELVLRTGANCTLFESSSKENDFAWYPLGISLLKLMVSSTTL